MESNEIYFKKCSVCKKPIPFKSKYFVCSVSSCNGLRTGLFFCSLACFEQHLPGARHRDAGAIEKTAPNSGPTPNEITKSSTTSTQTFTSASEAALKDGPQRYIPQSQKNSVNQSGSNVSSSKVPREVLVIASRLKEYITAKSEFNTSASVMDVLSDYIREACDRAIDEARAEGRKTVFDRDFKLKR